MSRHNLNLTLPFYFSPADSGGEGGDPSIGREGILDILNSTDDGEVEDIDLTPPAKGKNTESEDVTDDTKDENEDSLDKTEDGDEEDELDELEDELDEDEKFKDDELELVTMPRRKEILEKYPKLFKEFPGLEKAFFRERQYSELLPTIEDAREAVENSKTLVEFEKKLMNGDITTVLKAVKDEATEQNSQAFNKVIDTYLPALRHIDEKAYYHVIGTVIKGTIFNMVKMGRESQDEALESAAEVLNKFVFGSSKFTAPQKLAKESTEEDSKEGELSKREKEFQEKQFKTAQTDLNTRTGRVFDKAIAKHIDPKNQMTDYVKKTAIRDATENLHRLLESDSRFRAVLDKAWKIAFDKNFDSDSMERVERVIKSRASNILPSVIKKARNEALKGIGKRIKDTNDEDNDKDTGKVPSSSKRGPLKEVSKSGSNNRSQTKGEIPKGMSNRDFIMSD